MQKDDIHSVSTFRGVVPKVLKNISIVQILDEIRTGSFKDKVEQCRKLLDENNEEEYQKQKKKLPGFTPSGSFNGKRQSEALQKYSKLIILDIDKLSKDEALRIRDSAGKLDYTYAAFISPSARGVKIIVAVSNASEQHTDSYNKLKDWYNEQLTVKIDLSGKDINRLCFYSYDPDLYFNPNSKIFDHNLQLPIYTPSTFGQNVTNKLNGSSMNNDDRFLQAIQFSENIRKFENGNRNNFILLLAGNLNRLGVPLRESLQMIISRYASSDFKEQEIEATVKSAYRKQKEHGLFSELNSRLSTKKSAKEVIEVEINSLLKQLNIKHNDINENVFLEILLNSLTEFDDYASLYKFCAEGMAELISVFDDLTNKKIIEEILTKEESEKEYWLEHESTDIKEVVSYCLKKDLSQEEEEVHRLKICIFKISSYDKLLSKRILDSRFAHFSIFEARLTELAKYHDAKQYWIKEFIHITEHLLIPKL